jgi:hypothetical protein
MRVRIGKKQTRFLKLKLILLSSLLAYLAFNYIHEVESLIFSLLGFLWPVIIFSKDVQADVARRNYRLSFVRVLYLLDGLTPRKDFLKKISYVFLPGMIVGLITLSMNLEFSLWTLLGSSSWYIYANLLRR